MKNSRSLEIGTGAFVLLGFAALAFLTTQLPGTSLNLGGVIAMPLLSATFTLIALYGAQLIGVQQMGVDAGAYWSQTQNAVDLHDVWEGVVKSVVFGVAVSLVAVYEGYHAEATPEGVGLATTRTVVVSSVLVLLLNYLLTAAFLTTK